MSLGTESSPTHKFNIKTPTGNVQVDMQPIEEGLKTLGITVNSGDASAINLSRVSNKKQIIELWMQDNNISVRCRQSMYIYSVLGLRRCFLGKVHIPHQTSATNTAEVSKDLKKILQLNKSTANAALYADVKDWGLACPNCVDMDNLAAAS